MYGLGRSEELIAEPLHPYPAGVVIGTKSGYQTRRLPPGEQRLPPNGRPDHLLGECEKSLRRLRVDRIDLYQLHTPDPSVPYAESLGARVELRRQGKIRHIGISNVTRRTAHRGAGGVPRRVRAEPVPPMSPPKAPKRG
jgi:aryl-alcohol dehydrogenase-like predicted oxidoreductase